MKIATGWWILLALVWIGLYWPLLADEVPAFRDAFHFYYPLEHWLDQQARLGDYFPQYNPLDGLGASVVGEMSTGLFYPGRILWWLPGLSVAQRMGLVLLLHTSLAGIGAAFAARRMRLASAAQILAATAYSLSGPVFFQHVNPIYLISAAWLPWVIGECWTIAYTPTPTSSHAPTPRVNWYLWIAGCSLMTLGGDAQTTVHCGLLTVIALLCSAWSAGSIQPLIGGCAKLTVAVIAVAGLTAIQSLPTWYWVQSAIQSPVTLNAEPSESVPAILQSMAPQNYDVARGSPYAYSIAPWHGVTLLWSNSLGHFMPQHSRYLSAWGAEPRMWTVSLSVGLLTVLLAMCCLSIKDLRRSTAYLWLIALFSGTAMLGNYAPVWMLRSAMRLMAMDDAWLPSDDVGGTYWLLQQCLPGYSAFRYPGKWSPVFAISLALCAAHGLDQWEPIRKMFWRILRPAALVSWLVCVACVGLAIVPSFRAAFRSWVAGAQPDGWLGAVDARAAEQTILISSLLAGLLVALALLSVQRVNTRWQPWCLVFLVLVELSYSAQQWLVTTPAAGVTVRLPVNESVDMTRVWAGVGQAHLELDVDEAASMREKLEYQQQFALGKLHLMSGDTANVSAFLTLTPQAVARVRHQLAQHDRLLADNPQLDEALAWLGVQWRLVRGPGLHWQSIENPSPLIGWTNEGYPENTLHVKYLSPTQIRLRVDSNSDAHLVLRLFQDGGWRATLRAEDRLLSSVPQVSHLGLFQTLDVPAGHWDIELRYRTPGLLLGVCVSGVTCVLLVIASSFAACRRA